MVKPDSFQFLAGESEVKEYQFGSKRERHLFCKHGGVRPFGIGDSPGIGTFYAVSVTCLDGVSDYEFADTPILYIDGRNDDWLTPPAVSHHL